jgi:hypothetical protein
VSDPKNPDESGLPPEPVEPVVPAERIEPVEPAGAREPFESAPPVEPVIPDEPVESSPVAPPPPLAPPPPPAAYGAPAADAAPGYGAPSQPAYGAPAQPAYGGASTVPAAKPTPVFSLISLIAGIIGVIGSGVVLLPFVGGILQLFIPAAAVVLGYIGRKREPNAKGMWLTGIILGFIGVGIAIISLVFWGILFGTRDPSQYYFGY